MTVKAQDVSYPTEALILAHPRRHYRASIGTVHWQLRSLISASGCRTVYYPTGTGNINIQRLDTESRETETINILPFLPRCLVVKGGWICSGGEYGEFTAIDLAEDSFAPDLATDDAALEQALDSNPDASQLLEHSGDLIGSLRVRNSIRTLARARKGIVGKTKIFGKERVNCITLWFPPHMLKPYEGAYDEEVAVLANNDKSVAVVRLRNQELLAEIEYPDCVNRAVCSPDGRLLIAVSDDPYLYIHEQTRVEGSIGKPTYRWCSRNKIHLISQSKEDRSDNRGSFAACFSSTGRYLAVGTQYGAISIFDTTTLADPDVISLITSFTSSRPNDSLGAVRAMEFAPGPIDLLAWTEDRGRVGVVDMRNGCISRQVIYLDKEDDYDHITLSDRSLIDPRLLDHGRNGLNSTADLPSRRSVPDAGHMDIDRLNQPLTPDETRVLEALQEHSRRRVQRAAERVSSTTQRLLGAERSVNDRDARRPGTEAARTERNAIVSAAVNDVLGSIRDIRDQRDRLRTNLERQERLRYARDGVETEELLRRGPNASESGTPAGPATARRSNPPMAVTTTLIPPVGSEDTLSARRALASRLMGDLPPSTSGWSDLEALWNLSFDSGPYTTNPYENLRSAVDADARRRERAASLIRDWETNSARRMGLGLRHSIADPFDTAGLAWSDDGQKLFVGAENGIYEFHVNMLNRKFMPTTEPR